MAQLSDTDFLHGLTACHECDALLQDRKLSTRRKASCPRCGAVLHISRSNSMERTLALSLTGLLLFLPANLLPILTLELLGQSNTSTMLNGIYQILTGGYWWMALLVCFCSIVAPLFKLVALAYVSASCLFHWPRALAVKLLKLYQHLDEWGMFDVYVLGILISFIKMKDLGTLTPGLGLFCFVSLLLVATAISSVFDQQLAWRSLGAGNHGLDRPDDHGDTNAH